MMKRKMSSKSQVNLLLRSNSKQNPNLQPKKEIPIIPTLQRINQERELYFPASQHSSSCSSSLLATPWKWKKSFKKREKKTLMILLIWISITTKKYALRLQIIVVGSCHQHNQTRFIVWLSESELTITILARRRRSPSQLNPYLMHSSPPNPLAWRQGSSWTFSIGQKTKRRSC